MREPVENTTEHRWIKHGAPIAIFGEWCRLCDRCGMIRTKERSDRRTDATVYCFYMNGGIIAKTAQYRPPPCNNRVNDTKQKESNHG